MKLNRVLDQTGFMYSCFVFVVPISREEHQEQTKRKKKKKELKRKRNEDDLFGDSDFHKRFVD